MTTHSEVRIAGVPWPAYKVVALVLGFLTLVSVAAVTATASTAVLAGAAVTTALWLAVSVARRSHP